MTAATEMGPDQWFPTVMGDLVGPADEEQIVRRDEDSWLIDGVTSIEDVLHALTAGELKGKRIGNSWRITRAAHRARMS